MSCRQTHPMPNPSDTRDRVASPALTKGPESKHEDHRRRDNNGACTPVSVDLLRLALRKVAQ
jgi:hypothetical protein